MASSPTLSRQWQQQQQFRHSDSQQQKWNKTSTNGKPHLAFLSVLQFWEVLFCLDLPHNGLEERLLLLHSYISVNIY